MLSVRPATTGDMGRLLEMGQRFIESSKYTSIIPVRLSVMESLVRNLIEADNCALFVVEHDSAGVVGMIGLSEFNHPLTQDRFATELFWWVDPGYRGRSGLMLLREAEAWAEWREVVGLHMVAPNKEVANLYRKLGYAEIETSFMKPMRHRQE